MPKAILHSILIKKLLDHLSGPVKIWKIKAENTDGVVSLIKFLYAEIWILNNKKVVKSISVWYHFRIIVGIGVLATLLACKQAHKVYHIPAYKTIAFKNIAYFCNESSGQCFFLQYVEALPLPQKEIGNVQFSKKENLLYIHYTDGTFSRWTLNEKVYGIGEINAFLKSSNPGKLILNHPGAYFIDQQSVELEQAISLVHCTCELFSEKRQHKKWTSGGEGASQCGLTDGGGSRELEKYSCSVSCNPVLADAYCSYTEDLAR